MTENANDRYERLAAEFQRDTGMMAPGKSVPVEFNDTTDPRERMARWDAWLAARAVARSSAPTPQEGTPHG